MAAVQAHRGPDGTRMLGERTGTAVLAMNTLLIVDETAECGPYREPESGLTLTFNGEIYNWRALARRWRVPVYAGDTDAHLILRAWRDLGASCLPHLDGMFALAMHDPRTGTVTIARDGFGEKPLYWRLDGDRLVFASEMIALQAYGPAPLVGRPEMLSIEGFVGCDTPYSGIQLLAAGHSLTFDVATGSARVARFWSLEDATPYDAFAPFQADYRRAVGGFVDLLREHVATRVPAGDWGLLLSGGLDSAVLAYLMRPPVCFTVKYPGPRLDESVAAARIAKAIGAEHVVIEPTCGQFQAATPDIVRALGYPMGNASTFSEWMVYEAAAQRGLRVVVGGSGPDELLLGYARHALALFGAEAAFAAGMGAYAPLASVLDGAEPSLQDRYARLILRGPDAADGISGLVRSQFTVSSDAGRALTLSDLATSWRALMLTSDTLSARHGLERRSPYLAHTLAAYMYAMPLGHKICEPARGKALLRDAAATFGVPDAVRDARDKLGFSSPVPQWLSGELEPWCLASIAAARDVAPVGILRSILDRGLEVGGPYSRHRVLALMTSVWVLQHDREGLGDTVLLTRAS